MTGNVARTTLYYISTTRDRFTDRQMRIEARALGLDAVVINPLTALLAIDEMGRVRIVQDGRPLTIRPKSLVYRKSILPIAWVIQKFLLHSGATGVAGKTRGSGKAGLDKLGDTVLLAGRGVRVAPTVAVTRLEQLDGAVAALAGNFPVILKKMSGTHGIGVFLAPSPNALKPIVEYVLREDGQAVLLLQPFVETSEGKDIRAVVLNGDVIASVMRDNTGRDFRANVYQGAVPEVAELTEDQRRTALRAAEALGCEFGGVDLLLGPDGPLVAEVNSPCDFSFVERTTGVPVTRKILTFLMEKHAAGNPFPARIGDGWESSGRQ
jgi:RimK family alpha-L-glutamate ligase